MRHDTPQAIQKLFPKLEGHLCTYLVLQRNVANEVRGIAKKVRV